MRLENFFSRPENSGLKQFGQIFGRSADWGKLENKSDSAAEQTARLEAVKRNYQPATSLRERRYQTDLASRPATERLEAKNQQANLATHNEIVLDYAVQLAEAHNLSTEDKVAVYLATIFHDSGKLASGLLQHHLKSREYAEQLLADLPPVEQDGQEVKLTAELKEKILQAIERHMNHPFLVGLKNGQRFPEPENDVDKIVFDADMMANVGFKNVCFRLNSEKYLTEDLAAAERQGIPALEETFNNVMEGVRVLDKAVLSEPAQKEIKKLIMAVEDIFDYLKENMVYQAVQDKFSLDGNFNFKTINQAPGGLAGLKSELNKAIRQAAQVLKIDPAMVNNFIM